jgi:hypothetical protein
MFIVVELWNLGKDGKNLKIDVPYNPTIPHLGIYLKEYKPIYSFTSMIIAVLVLIAKMWN